MSNNPYDKLTPAHILDLLESVIDPDFGIGIVELGLIYDIRINSGVVEIDMTLTSMGCPSGEYLYQNIKETLEKQKCVKSVEVNLVWDPPWDKDRVDPEVRFALGLF